MFIYMFVLGLLWLALVYCRFRNVRTESWSCRCIYETIQTRRDDWHYLISCKIIYVLCKVICSWAEEAVTWTHSGMLSRDPNINLSVSHLTELVWGNGATSRKFVALSVFPLDGWSWAIATRPVLSRSSESRDYSTAWNIQTNSMLLLVTCLHSYLHDLPISPACSNLINCIVSTKFPMYSVFLALSIHEYPAKSRTVFSFD
jgi:hypothetical protein